jgi:hypothetical protein
LFAVWSPPSVVASCCRHTHEQHISPSAFCATQLLLLLQWLSIFQAKAKLAQAPLAQALLESAELDLANNNLRYNNDFLNNNNNNNALPNNNWSILEY